jgi:transposase
MNDKEVFKALLGLNRPWYISRVEIDSKVNRVDIWIEHEPGIRFACPECGKQCGIYDHAAERILRHLNTCAHQTFLHVRIPRVHCPDHGIRRIISDFGESRSGMTYQFESRVIDIAAECSVEATARLCGMNWDMGWHVIERAVRRGRSRKPYRLPPRIGIDEKAISKGHRYESLVHDLDEGTVEYIADDRRQKSLESYYRLFSKEERSGVQAVAMDIWDPYIAATIAYIPGAKHKIVYDRFHVIRHVVNAVDSVRKQEHKALQEHGDDRLKGTKYLWLWSHENIPEHRKEEFEKIRSQKLKVSRAWAIKETLRHMWEYRSVGWMRRFFDQWYWWARHSRLEPIMKAAATLKRHIDNIVTYARHRITNASGESINAKIEKVKRMACGFRNREHYKTAIYFHCGGLDLYPRPPAEKRLSWSTA